MSELDPPEPEEVECPDCGEEENLKHFHTNIWICLICGDYFVKLP